MANTIFKGFKQVVSGYTSFKEGYIYFVRTAADKKDGYVYFNGKEYGTAKDVESSIKAILGTLPEGYATWAAYMAAISSELGNVGSEIADEKAARISGDTALENAIEAEESRATAAEGELADNIANEATARENADTVLSNRIKAIEDVAGDYATKSDVISAVSAEESAREDADAALQDAINDEETRAKGAEATLTSDLDDEVTRAKGAETTLTSNLTAEVTRATGAEEALDRRLVAAEGEIDKLQASAHTHGNKDVLDGITSGKVTAWDNAAASAHTHGNKDVLDGIDANDVAAWDAAEQNAKDYADDQVSAEETRATGVESGLQAAIDTEASARTAADATLQAAITAEGTARTAADEALDTRIDALEALTGNTATKDDVATAKQEAIDASKVTMTTGASSGDVAKTYVFSQNGVEIGKVELAKDLVVESGEVIESGDTKYLRLHIANSDRYVDILVSDLAHVYSQGNGIEISSGDMISAKVVEANGLSVGANGIAMALASNAANGAMSSADYTKLAGIEEGAQVNVQADWNQTDSTEDDFIQNKPENLVQDANYKHITVTETSVSDGTTTFNKYDDTALAGRVSTIEADYLKAADKTALQAAITAEGTARTAADKALSDRIDALEAFTGDTATKSDVATAKSEAIASASTYTDTQVSAEETRAKDVESGLDTRLTAAENAIDDIEADYLTSTDKNNLQTAISNEATARAAEDEALDTRVKALESSASSAATKQEVENAKQEAITAATAYTDAQIEGLDATVTGTSNDVEITVTETNGVLTAATASVKRSAEPGNIIVSNNDGLFAAIYYEDLDA